MTLEGEFDGSTSGLRLNKAVRCVRSSGRQHFNPAETAAFSHPLKKKSSGRVRRSARVDANR